MNEVLLVVTVAAAFLGVLLFSKMGKEGLYVWIAIAIIIANIETVKSIDVFGVSMTLGTPAFASLFLATDILNEKYGYKASRKGVDIALFSSTIFTMLIQIDLLFRPSAFDVADGAMQTIFALSFRLSLLSVVMMYTSNRIDCWLFQKIKERHPKHLWLRNNIATIASQVIENIFLFYGAFYGVYSLRDIGEIVIVTTVAESLIALLDTPFLYWAVKDNGQTTD